MASPLTPEQMVATLDKWWVPYDLYPGWETRTRPGEIHPRGWGVHHTGGAFSHSLDYLEFLFETGRPDEGIPGPLCQQALDDLGIVHIGSIGRANSMGAGNLDTLQHVIAEDWPWGYDREIAPGPDDYLTGNSEYWAVEIMYPGTLPMRPAQYTSLVLLGAALCNAYGWTPLSVIGHREHTVRKWDPGLCPLDRLRVDIRTALDNGPGGADMDKNEFLAAMQEAAARNTAYGRALGDAVRDILLGQTDRSGIPIRDVWARATQDTGNLTDPSVNIPTKLDEILTAVKQIPGGAPIEHMHEVTGATGPAIPES